MKQLILSGLSVTLAVFTSLPARAEGLSEKTRFLSMINSETKS